MVLWAGLPRSPGHAFHDRLPAELTAAGFDGFVEGVCAPLCAARRGRPSLPPRRCFRMPLVGCFEGIDSKRGLEWRCSDSLSLREFLRLGEREPMPDQSWLGRARSRLPLELHGQAFTWVLQRLAEHGLVRGERIGVDGSTMEANAALRAIVRRGGGETRREMLRRMAAESGIETPAADDLIRLDRGRKGKTLSNTDWESPADPDARVARMKDGRTRLARKAEHAADLDTGAVVAAEMHPAAQGDTATLPGTLASAATHLAAVEAEPTPEAPAALVADKGCRSRAGLKAWRTGRGKAACPSPGATGSCAARRRRAPCGLQQPRPAAVRGGPAGVQAARRTRGTRVCADPGPRRHAPGLAARPRERAQALPDPCRRMQPGTGHAPADRR